MQVNEEQHFFHTLYQECHRYLHTSHSHTIPTQTIQELFIARVQTAANQGKIREEVADKVSDELRPFQDRTVTQLTPKEQTAVLRIFKNAVGKKD